MKTLLITGTRRPMWLAIHEALVLWGQARVADLPDIVRSVVSSSKDPIPEPSPCESGGCLGNRALCTIRTPRARRNDEALSRQSRRSSMRS
jgi:hypothetical protein